jgi:NTP pyrophosphatase (non-canonical NTP hydrolase)
MDLNEYQISANSTAIYPGRKSFKGLIYCTLGITGESGEFAEKIKKVLRDDNGTMSEEKKKEITKELGDVLWYVSQCCSELGITLEEVAINNLEKLFSRKNRNVLKGNGDNR